MARVAGADVVYNVLDGSTERYVDMRIVLRRAATGEILLDVGGRWDRLEKRYVGAARTAVVIGVQESQVDAVRLLREWLLGFMERKRAKRRGEKIPPAPFYSLVCHGGRRGGKTTFVARMLLPCILVAVPGTIAWTVTQELEEGDEDEVRRNLNLALPKTWIRWAQRRGSAVLANGSRIVARTALVARRLKRGRADVVVLNEPQEMKEEAYKKVRPAVADEGGLVVLAANPANENAAGYWVDKLVKKARYGVAKKVRELEFDRRKNAAIDDEALTSTAGEFSKRDYDIEIEGKFLPRIDVVFHGWDDNPYPAGNQRARPRPELDATEDFLLGKLGRQFRYVLGADFQRRPHMAATISKFFDDPAGPCPCGDPHGWYVGAVIAENAAEEELCDRLDDWFARHDPALVNMTEHELKAYDATSWRDLVAWVPDGTGDYQDADRTKGGTSWDRVRMSGYRHLYYPDPQIERNNPRIVDRVAAANARFGSVHIERDAEGREVQVVTRHWFIDPIGEGCDELGPSIAEWETMKGGVAANKGSKHAHKGDAGTYQIIRLYPRRRARDGRPDYTPITPIKSKGDLELDGL
jgi:hypothetical protein